ncbi:MAG: DNA helicase-2/ATP-dependent DNA helicase PcrA, partial [Urechidicola sp.]
MDVSYLVDSLNEYQRQAVSAPTGSYLILAGAGSGKTRVLTHRIAWLIQTAGVSPHGILAVTFTNKAAKEMRGRIESLMQTPLRGMWVGTFHGIAHRLLRAHWQEAGLKQNFQILDGDDQLRLVKRVLASLDLDEKKWPARQALWYINGQKDEGLRPKHIEDFGDLYIKTHVRIYAAYEEACERGGMVDFAELLLRAHELWLQNPRLLLHYQQRFSQLLVDEFQDTNTIQYAWLRLLAGDRNNILVVGDDDQSIYGWRGAKIENIQKFSTDFPTSQTIKLEQNYRSTGSILNAANGLISSNPSRLGKELWTEAGDGELIKLYAAFNEIDEARYIVERIKEWVAQGNSYSECAILYRSNAQSRVLEEALLRSRLPYRIYGGQRFFERMEIRNVLAYMRLLGNKDADAAFERVVNTPSRGIGGRSIDEIRQLARSK